MTLKNSFWVDIRENNKRRTWLWVISWLFFLLYYILGIALLISNGRNRYAQISSISQLAGTDMHTYLKEMVVMFFLNPYTLLTAVIILSAVCAMQGFSYLNSRREIDFYHSLPVKKKRRFFVIWLNGIFIYLIPSLISLTIAILIAAAQGLITAKFLGSFILMYLMFLALFIGVYHVCLIAVMLTGNVVITFFAIIILQGYETIMLLLHEMYMMASFEKYISAYMGSVYMFFTPYWFYAMYWDSPDPVGSGAGFLMMLFLLIQAAVFLSIAYFLYRRRPAEACGRALSFNKLKPFIKVAIVVPMALIIANVFRIATSYGEYKNGNSWFIVLGLIISVVITSCLIEVIYELDIKAALKNKRHIIISGLIAGFILLAFRLDLFGYDSYIPRPEKIDSYAISITGLPNQQYYDGEFMFHMPFYHVNQHMFAKDTENIYRLASIQPEINPYQEAIVIYRLSNGRTVSRRVWLDFNHPDTIPILDKITSTDAYTKGNFVVNADFFDHIWFNNTEDLRMDFSYEFGIYFHIIDEGDIKRVIDAFREDLKNINFSDMNDSLPHGRILLSNIENQHFWHRSFAIDINEKCVNTRAVLNELGFDADVPLKASDVMYVEVYEVNEIWNDTDFYYHNYYYDYRFDYRSGTYTEARPKVYSDAEEIEAIIAAIWPGRYRIDTKSVSLYDEGYYVNVYLKEDVKQHNNHYLSYSFIAGMVPDFVVSR